jgi:modulator of FtsH protease
MLADVVRGRRRPGLIAPGEHDRRPVRGQHPGRFQPKTRAGSGHDSDAAALVTHVLRRPVAAGAALRHVAFLSGTLLIITISGYIPAMVDYSANYATATRDQTRTLFSHVMWLVAAATGFFALGTFAGRDLSPGWSVAWFIAGFGCLIAMNFTRRSSSGGASVVLLMCVGLFLGLAMGPAIVYYSATSPKALWQAAGATALFMLGFGAYGYATRRDLTAIGRISFFALIGLIIFGIILIFVRIPGGDRIYAVIGLVVFAGLTVFDFQRLRRSSDRTSAPLIAASIFLDALNVFLFFLRIFSGGRD